MDITFFNTCACNLYCSVCNIVMYIVYVVVYLRSMVFFGFCLLGLRQIAMLEPILGNNLCFMIVLRCDVTTHSRLNPKM